MKLTFGSRKVTFIIIKLEKTTCEVMSVVLTEKLKILQLPLRTGIAFVRTNALEQ